MFATFRSKEHAKFLWLQDPKESNVDNLNNVRREKLADISGTKRRYI